MGYGDGDEATTVRFSSDSNDKHIATYFRHAFFVNDVADWSALSLWVLRDDGIVVHLNGDEIYRDNLPAGAITYRTRATEAIIGAAENI